MGDPETKQRRSQQRKRDQVAKWMHENTHPKVFDPRKEVYKRVKLDPRDYEGIEDERKDIGEDY
jgi:hypothetical protein